MTLAGVVGKRMTVPQIRERAKTLGITPGKMKKAELIHSISDGRGLHPVLRPIAGGMSLDGLLLALRLFQDTGLTEVPVAGRFHDVLRSQNPVDCYAAGDRSGCVLSPTRFF